MTATRELKRLGIEHQDFCSQFTQKLTVDAARGEDDAKIPWAIRRSGSNLANPTLHMLYYRPQI